MRNDINNEDEDPERHSSSRVEVIDVDTFLNTSNFSVFIFNKFLPPIVDGGQVYVPNYNGGVDVYAQ